MLNTLALAAALSLAPGQAGALTLTNVRSTYGYLGAERTTNKVLPGDSYFVAFDIEGVQVDGNGKVLYSMAMEVTNNQGRVQFKQEPRDLEALNSLGGNRLPAFAHIEVGLDQPPGEYTIKVTVTDRTAKASQTLERKIEVLPKAFGIVRLASSSDPEMRAPAPNIGVTGQSIWVNFVAVGFERGAKMQPNVAVELRVLDESGKLATPKPFSGEVNDGVPQNMPAVPMQFFLSLNRPGKFTIELEATDKVSGKTAKLSFPLQVLEQGK